MTDTCAVCGEAIGKQENALWKRIDGNLTACHLICAGENPNPPPKSKTIPPKRKKTPKTPTPIEVEITSPTLPAGLYFDMTTKEINTLLKGRTLTLAEPTECPRCNFMIETGAEVLLTKKNELIHTECPE